MGSAVMKLNISYPATGAQKLVDIEDEKKVRIFYEKRMGAEVEVDSLGDEWKGYVFRIAGGNDKQGFPMKQGILTTGRVRLLFSKGHSCYRERRDGERDASLFVDALLMLTSPSWLLLLSRKANRKFPASQMSLFLSDWDLNVPPRSASCSIFPRKMMSLSMSSSDHFPSKRERNRSTAHPRSKDW